MHRAIELLLRIDFLSLNDRARIVLTDSGGVQEETTVLGVPCLTRRENTERPATVKHGMNQIVGAHRDRILTAVQSNFQKPAPVPASSILGRQSGTQDWDGYPRAPPA